MEKNNLENDDLFNLPNMELEDMLKYSGEEAEKETQEIQKKHLPENEEYKSAAVTIDMTEIWKNPRKYIMEECIKACEELWSKNIYTFMTSDPTNPTVWIKIDTAILSSENLDLIEQLKKDEEIKITYDNLYQEENLVCIETSKYKEEASKNLLEQAEKFKMQDVPYKTAYITVEEYLIKHGCYDEVENPDYYYLKDLSVTAEPDLEKIIEYEKYEESIHSQKTIKKFNPNKITKSLEEYNEIDGCVYYDSRVYLSKEHFNNHLNYEKSKNATTEINQGKTV